MRASCTQDGVFTVQSGSIYRTLALITHPRAGGLERRDDRFIGIEISSGGFWGDGIPTISVSNPRYHYITGLPEVRLWWAERGINTSDNMSVVGIDTGSGLQSLLFEGESTVRGYDPNGTVRLFARRYSSDPTWDYLTINFNNGTLTWRRTTQAPN